MPNTASTASAAPAFTSVFECTFDVVVTGAGFIGHTAARKLAAAGRSVLLVETSGDLLWETTRAFEDAGSAASDSRLPGAAGLEITAAHALVHNELPQLRPLLYSAPLSVALAADGRIAALTLATKSGPRTVRAAHWIDATENGALARLAAPALQSATRAPARRYRNLFLQSADAARLDEAAATFRQRHPEITWSATYLATERRLRWAVSGDTPAHTDYVALIRDLRASVPADVHFTLSHTSLIDYPVYDATTASAQSLGNAPANLTLLSPAFRHDAIATPADRAAIGSSITIPDTTSLPPPLAATCATSTLDVRREAPPPPPPPPAAAATHTGYDVVVAGTGTAGAHAAIAAARGGARTLALDHTTYPGGIGTGGGICGYFHGHPGGLQEEINRRTAEMTSLLTGVPVEKIRGWNYEAKRYVLLEMFAESGVTFIGDALLWSVETTDAASSPADAPTSPLKAVTAALAVINGRPERIPAAAFIDGTGDADLAIRAGARFIEGRPGDGRTLAYSQSIFSANLSAEGRAQVVSCNFDAGWCDPVDPEDITRARLLGISQHLAPVLAGKVNPVAFAPLLGLRQSRHIVADRQLTQSDMIHHARFDDSIGETDTVGDTHSVNFEFENDDCVFYYWVCRLFRTQQRCELPYGMLLPRDLANVWVPSRATGVTIEAAYGMRMQRDLQRLAEAAGLAAALAVGNNQKRPTPADARAIDIRALQTALEATGAKTSTPPPPPSDTDAAVLLAAFDTGLPGKHLWQLAKNIAQHRDEIVRRLDSTNPRISFYAAAILAASDIPPPPPPPPQFADAVEARLIRALTDRETGPTPDEHRVPGAFGQIIDLPFWALAITSLRRVGTSRCLPALRDAADRPSVPLCLRTIIACTLERLALRLGDSPELRQALDALVTHEITDGIQPMWRSNWPAVHGEPQQKLGNDRGADTLQDHTWQLHLVVARARRAIGQPIHAAAAPFRHDPRALVRRAFVRIQ
ncbi:FAD-dependent oxidoreductase [Opitutaceae bacterium TAV3]|nr:FAD-dependent oxidoreductase [Opitutaceae bacterium TAV3]